MQRLISILIIVFLSFSVTTTLTAQETTEESIPNPITLVDEGDYNILNILLIGTAAESPNAPGLTDAILILSINRSLQSVSIVSIPRDLYVYIPGFDMKKINQAHFFGEMRDESNTGIALLKKTILYNLGLEIDYYARVNYSRFLELIDWLGGIQITVDCAIEDWKLIDREADTSIPENWETFVLWTGVHTIDADTALWYVRSRRTSSDIDRGRRQQDVLRALWRKLNERGLLQQIPELWGQLVEIIDTDVPLTVALDLLPLALQMDTGDVEYYTFQLKREINNGRSPEGSAVLVPVQAEIERLMQQLVVPPTENRIEGKHPIVAVVNSSGIRGMARVAADRIELEGFQTVVVNESSPPRQYNFIEDYTGLEKNNPVEKIQRAIRTSDEGVEYLPNPDREYDYKVFIGSLYPFSSCTRSVFPPETPWEESNSDD